jgi:hypothetical protein
MDAIEGVEQVTYKLALLTLTITACCAHTADKPRTKQGIKLLSLEIFNR